MKIIISGGGTGGHIYPAIAIADALKRRDVFIDILFVGAMGRMEMEKVPAAGYKIEGLWISGFQRKLTITNLLFPVKVINSLLRCRTIVKSFMPDAVVGVGGYASGPLVRVAAGMGIPSVLQEQNSYPGVTNKILANKANLICVAYPGMEKYFPAKKIRLTGNPMRSQLAKDISREEAAAYFGLDANKKTILAFGGSLGARTINETIKNSYDLVANRNDIQVLWQIGKLYADTYLDTPSAKLSQVKANVFIDRMDLAYALADVVIARAGAITISELALTGKPSILVPSPYVAEDHQTHNAMSLVEMGAAILIKDGDAPQKAFPEAIRLLNHPEELQKLEYNIMKLARQNAADEIADMIIQLAQQKGKIQMKELKEYNHIYFLGIGGIGMSALARFCLLWNVKVSGYDRQASSVTDALIREGAEIQFEDDPEKITAHPELVIYTPAIKPDNRIYSYFLVHNVPMVKRSEALEWTTQGIDTIGVAGTHGKTTTSSMISYLLDRTGIRHTALLGGIAVNYDSNFISTNLDLMVVEADEYDRSFHRLHPRWVVLTAMDPDHLDIYGTYEEMLNGYRQFLKQIQAGGTLIHRHDLTELIGKEVMEDLQKKEVKVISFGLNEGNYHTSDMKVEKGIWHWTLVTPEKEINDMALHMPGRHNVLNATAACAMALEMGSDGKELKDALPGFKGVSRRFEIRYQDNDHVLIDDYAHHPEELIAAITAAKETYGEDVMGVFQPHLYTRTRDLADGFAAALDLLDVPVIIDIYPAREKPIPGISSQTIFDLMKNPNKKWCRGDTWIDWVTERKPKVLITLGAGDLDKHIPELIKRLYKND